MMRRGTKNRREILMKISLSSQRMRPHMNHSELVTSFLVMRKVFHGMATVLQKERDVVCMNARRLFHYEGRCMSAGRISAKKRHFGGMQ